MKKHFLRIIISVLVLATLLSVTVSAVGTPSFTRWETNNNEIITTVSRDMFSATGYVTGSSLGLDYRLEGLTDIQYADGHLYVLCGEESKLLVLNESMQFEREIIITQDGTEVDFTDAQGIFVDGEDLFLLDTLMERVLQADLNGVVKREIVLPESEVIPEDYLFQPISMIKDTDNNYYIVSQDSYYGALFYNSDFEFQGFFGANTVQTTALDTIAYIWDLLTNTDVKRSKQTRLLPYAFNDITMDPNGYLYTCNGATSNNVAYNGTGQIQQLSPSGINVLMKRKNKGKSVAATGYMFLENHVESTYDKRLVQNFCNIDINDAGFIFALDNTYGLIYVYDTDCNLITAFGGGAGKGDRLGLFKSPVAMTLMGDKVLIADNELCNITTFDITPFGKKVFEAQRLYLLGNYTETEQLWKEILTEDSACIYAYRGLARVFYAKGEYKKAMDYAEKAYDYVTYDEAYQQVRKEFLKHNFVWIFAGAVVLIVGIFVFAIKMKKRETSMIKNEKLRVMLHTSIHPFESMKDIKYKKKGSYLWAVILLLLFTITSILKMTETSFLFRTADVYSYNALYTLATTAGLVLLFVIANWLISTLMSGKGKFGEIFIATAYCLTPMIVINLLVTGLSYCLSYEDEALITGLLTVAVIYTLFLLIVSIMTIHDYTFGKFLLTTIITVFLMIMIVFIGFMVVIMLSEFWKFAESIYREVAYR